MGLFLGNLHLRSSELSLIQDLVTTYAAGLGLEPVAADGDRTFVLSFGSGWVSICDEELLADLDGLERLATVLSKDCEALAVMVHDSDALCLSLFRNGRHIDRYCSAPEVLGIESTFKPAHWNGFVSEIGALRSLLARRSTFAEDALPELGQLIALPERRLLLRHDEPPPGATVLHFRQPARKPASGVHLAKASDPAGTAPTGPVNVTVGETLPLRVVMENQGEAFQGLDLHFDGTALELLELGQAVAFDLPKSMKELRRLGPNRNVPGIVDGRRVSFAGLEIPSGSHVFGCNVLARATAEGAGALRIDAFPAGQTSAALTFHTADVRVSPALPRPLHYLDAMNSMFYVKRMANPRILSGVVILPDAMPAIVPAIERWVAANHTGETDKLQMFSIKHAKSASLFASLPRPKKSKAAPGDKDWKKLTASLPDFQTISGNGGWYGFACQVSLNKDTGYCPHLSFWVEASRAPASGLLDSIIEDFMRAGALQAFTARWDWIPAFDTLDEYERTPYEAACGAQNGRNYMGRKWCSRYLRGFGDTVWLGATLAGHAGLSATDGFLKLEGTPDVERSLAALLATPEEYARFDETV